MPDSDLDEFYPPSRIISCMFCSKTLKLVRLGGDGFNSKIWYVEETYVTDFRQHECVDIDRRGKAAVEEEPVIWKDPPKPLPPLIALIESEQ